MAEVPSSGWWANEGGKKNYDTFGFCGPKSEFLFGILGSVFKTLVFYFGFLGINK